MQGAHSPCRFLTTDTNALRYSQINLIRCALKCELRREHADFVVTAFLNTQEALQQPLRRWNSHPCSPVSVFCSLRSCSRCRSWPLDLARPPCCSRPTRNSRATHHANRPPNRHLRINP